MAPTNTGVVWCAAFVIWSWQRGAALTAKSAGLWDAFGCVSAEDVRHMQSRVVQFDAYAELTAEQLRAPEVAPCKVSFAKWLVGASSAYAARAGRMAAPIRPAEDEEADGSAGLVCL